MYIPNRGTQITRCNTIHSSSHRSPSTSAPQSLHPCICIPASVSLPLSPCLCLSVSDFLLAFLPSGERAIQKSEYARGAFVGVMACISLICPMLQEQVDL